ncbi:hypothetical protein B0T16DRAFT_455178 [Cercophora newfieldiana]|uniref:HNH nuclease domain-containing protein n=1 Tax=Cercophora newfieldiana TaxID=92897 RepID=A0AA39YHP9_9PEZI|nr:hypothetical protein B0T16DRAFT_455178 [Cercophora newfieldiana]
MAEPDFFGLLDRFLARESTTKMDRDALRRILTIVPPHEPTNHLLPVDEAKEKIKILLKLQRLWKSEFTSLTGMDEQFFKPLHPIIIATVMMMDIIILRGRIGKCFSSALRDFLRYLSVMPCFIKILTVTARNEDYSSLLELEVEEPKLEDELERKATRDDYEKADREKLDNHRCVVLGTGSPDVCHIIPFSLNSSDESRANFEKYLAAAADCLFYRAPECVGDLESTSENMDSVDENPSDDLDNSDDIDVDSDEDDLPAQVDLFVNHCRKIFSKKKGVSDKSWNQICLNSQLGLWWAYGYFAFKPLGVDGEFTPEMLEMPSKKAECKGVYTRIKLQFHWMPRRKDMGEKAPPLTVTKSSRPEEFSSMFDKTYGDLDTDGSNPVFADDRRTSVSHEVETGNIFYVKVENRYANRMLAALRIQWAVIKILSIAGGVESLEDVGDHPDYLDENLDWLGHRGTTLRELFKKWDD